MATTKTIQPTGATITIPEFTDQPDVRPVATDLGNITDAANALSDQIGTLVKQTTQSLTTDSSGMVDINTSKKPIVGVQVVKSSDSSACRAIQIRCRDYQGKLEYKYLIQEWGNGNPVLSTGITVYVTYIDINLT